MTRNAIRELWIRAETIHAVTYFAEESRAAARELGMRGFWMGYFAFRAAPLGAVGPDVVEAAFYNFAPAMVRRAVPEAWDHASPDVIVARRAESAADAIRRLTSDDQRSTALDAVHGLLGGSAGLTSDDRPLFGANRALPPSDDPVARLWQATTTLREYRGDGHVATLCDAAISGCQAHLLFAAEHRVTGDLLRDNRGWTEAEWCAERDRLTARGLLTSEGSLSTEGRRLRGAIEDATDRCARAFVGDRREPEIRGLVYALDPLARAITASGTIPFPNPMGLPPVE